MGNRQSGLVKGIIDAFENKRVTSSFGSPLYTLSIKYHGSVKSEDWNMLESLEKRGILRVLDSADDVVIIALTDDAVQHYLSRGEMEIQNDDE